MAGKQEVSSLQQAPHVRMNRQTRAKRRLAIANSVQRTGSPEEVARSYGVSIATVYKACHEHDVKIPAVGKGRGREVKMGTLEIIAELLRGTPQAEVARRWSVSRQRVQQIHRRAQRAGLIRTPPDTKA